ncbi:MAG: dihydrofolate reductase [Bacteroidota bacterium]
MIVTLVAAASENNVIGMKNKLVWNLPNDTRFFKNTTWSMPVIMGRKTFESLGNKPLNGRFNIVISRHPEQLQPAGPIETAGSLEQAIQLAGTTDAKEAFIVGGGKVYAEALPLANRIVLTRVHANVEGDAFFPVFSEKEWRLLSNMDFEADDKHQYAYSFQVWERIAPAAVAGGGN